MERKLEVIPAISDAIAIGTKNVASLALAALLYVITLWIPYLNVGTTIAMNTIPRKLAEGSVINPTFIFDSVYRRRMGDFFLLEGLLLMMLIPAFLFGYFPGVVLSLMYSLSLYIMLDDNVTPIEAFKRSNEATTGFKWTIFFISLLFGVAFCIVYLIVLWIALKINVTLITVILAVGLLVLGASCSIALNAVIYRNLYLNTKGETKAATEETAEL